MIEACDTYYRRTGSYMIDSNALRYKPYKDSRVKTAPGFTVGQSGALLIAEGKAGEKYIVKHTFPNIAANEFVGCWLAGKLGLPAPKAYLLTSNRIFSSMYAVAIEFLEDLKMFRFEDTTDIQKQDVLGHMVLTHLVRNMDMTQMNLYHGRVVSYDFSDGFEMEYMGLLLSTLKVSEDRGIDEISRIFAMYRENLTYFDYDLPETAAQMCMSAAEARKIMLDTARKVLDITDDEISKMGEDLESLYPLPIAVYYEECIHAMQKHVEGIS